ncbi:TPA: hypothetical protein L9K41_004753 [Klebsiella pneumoniae]|nr:hypothetical protein [Klebsiella pneumoniae]
MLTIKLILNHYLIQVYRVLPLPSSPYQQPSRKAFAQHAALRMRYPAENPVQPSLSGCWGFRIWGEEESD